MNASCDRFAPEARRVGQAIESLRRPDSLVFPIFTDLHTSSLTSPVTEAFFEAMQALSKTVRADGVIDLGDNLAMLGRNEHASNETIHTLIHGLFEHVASLWPCPLFPVNGNHDGIGTDFFKADFWLDMARGFDQGRARRENGSAWYYVDFDQAHVRMVALSLPSGSDLEAEHPSPLWAFGDEQLQWLAHTALNTCYDVLVVCHVPLFYDYSGDPEAKLGVWTGNRAAESFVNALCGWIDDRDEAEAIFSAFHEHKRCRIERLGIDTSFEGNARLIACLSGHMHDDSFFAPGETIGPDTNRLPCAQIQSGSTNVRLNQPLKDAELPIAMDIAVLTPSERRLTLVRFGAGEDRTTAW